MTNFRLFKWIHAIRVPDGTRRAIVYTIAAAREQLQQGHVVCIFAEGSLTRTGNLAEFHRGLKKLLTALMCRDPGASGRRVGQYLQSG